MLRSVPSSEGTAHAGDHVFPGAVEGEGLVRAATGGRAGAPRRQRRVTRRVPKLTGASARAHAGVSVPTVAMPRHDVESARTDYRSVVEPLSGMFNFDSFRPVSGGEP